MSSVHPRRRRPRRVNAIERDTDYLEGNRILPFSAYDERGYSQGTWAIILQSVRDKLSRPPPPPSSHY